MSISLAKESIDLAVPGALAHLRAQLRDDGLAFFVLAAANASTTLLRLAQDFGPVHPHDHADTDGVTIVAPSGPTLASIGVPGFGQNALAPHTDCSSVANTPELLFFMCQSQAQEGGETLLVDMREVFRILSRKNRQVLDALLRREQVIFGTGAYTYRGSIFEPCDDERICVRFRLDDIGFFSGSIVRAVCSLLEVIDKQQICVKLKPGEGYVLNNTWWLHGRRRFPGQREMIRILAHIDETSSRNTGIKKGFSSH